MTSEMRHVCGPALTFTRVAVCGRARACTLEVCGLVPAACAGALLRVLSLWRDFACAATRAVVPGLPSSPAGACA